MQNSGGYTESNPRNFAQKLGFTHNVVERSANAGSTKVSADEANVYLRNRSHERLHADNDENVQANLARAANFVMRHA